MSAQVAVSCSPSFPWAVGLRCHAPHLLGTPRHVMTWRPHALSLRPLVCRVQLSRDDQARNRVRSSVATSGEREEALRPRAERVMKVAAHIPYFAYGSNMHPDAMRALCDAGHRQAGGSCRSWTGLPCAGPRSRTHVGVCRSTIRTGRYPARRRRMCRSRSQVGYRGPGRVHSWSAPPRRSRRSTVPASMMRT